MNKASKILLTGIALLVLSATAEAATFDDVTPNNYFYVHVEELVTQGAIDSNKELFHPNDHLNRAEASKMLCYAAGLENTTYIVAPDEPNFSDVKTSDWFYESVACLYQASAINGYAGTDLFGPANPVTREEFAKMAMLVFGIPHYLPDENTFPDILPQTWSYEFIESMNFWSNINGYQDGYFHPQDPIIRGDAAVIIVQAQSPKITPQEYLDQS